MKRRVSPSIDPETPEWYWNRLVAGVDPVTGRPSMLLVRCPVNENEKSLAVSKSKSADRGELSGSPSALLCVIESPTSQIAPRSLEPGVICAVTEPDETNTKKASVKMKNRMVSPCK